MFIVAKSFTNKRGEMFLKIFPNQYPSIETAHAAMQSDYQEENQSDFLTAVSDAVSSIEKSRDVKEWHGLTKETAERFAREFMAERNPGR